MRKHNIAIALAFFFSISILMGASALDSYNADYSVQGAIVHAQASLKSLDLYNYVYPLPADSRNVTCNVNCTLIKGSKALGIIISSHSQSAIISYYSSSYLDNGKSRYFLLDFSHINSSEKSISVTLPEYATLQYPLDNSEKASIVPHTNNVTTNGVRLTIYWDNDSLSQNDALMVIYRTPQNSGSAWIIALIVLAVIALGAVSYYIVRKVENKKGGSSKAPPRESFKEYRSVSDITMNLYDEEKKIVFEIHNAGGEIWQKELQLKVGLSKVKLSRRLRALEEKKLIEKIPYGNTNKIHLTSSNKNSSTQESEDENNG
jgi:uncharacterized membrane protein